MPPEPTKPRLLLVATAIDPFLGSEGGKGWTWMKALQPFYELDILTLPFYVERVQGALPAGCRALPVGEDLKPGPMFTYYRNYERWCETLIPVCARLLAERPYAGLHHVTLGSFRRLPRYDRLGIPYTLGPLGGGECIPPSLLGALRLPLAKVLLEAARGPVNLSFTLVPKLRAVLAAATLTMATTAESAGLLEKMGARRTVVVFPDAIDGGENAESVLARRTAQAATLGEPFRCVCASRALWWKGIHLAIDFIAGLRARGINAVLDVYAAGPDLEPLRARARGLGLDGAVSFPGMVTRDELLRAYEACHLFVNPTMHDSASSALLEAYATGLPSMTLGLGGAATVTTERTGLNARVGRVDDWLHAGGDAVAGWIAQPERWLEVCRAAKARTLDFGPGHPQAMVQTHLQPVFSPAA